MEDNTVFNKALQFGVRITKLIECMHEKHRRIVELHLFRSSTHIGVFIAESQFVCCCSDFIIKLQLAIKEASEAKYWLLLLGELEGIDACLLESLLCDVNELLRMLSLIILSAKNNCDQKK